MYHRVEPLPETREALWRMSAESEVDLLTIIDEESRRVVDAVPGCVGLSITLRDHELTFTWLSTDADLRPLDAAQFLEDGPCEVAARKGEPGHVANLMDEEQWRLFALAGAAVGVHSSLSLPLMAADGPIGSMNFYGRDADTFTGRERHIAEIFGADVQLAVRNADLSMASRDRAKRALEVLELIDRIDIASGILAERQGISADEALSRLRDAAERADTPIAAIADVVITRKLNETTSPNDRTLRRDAEP
jgi:GAF domain-containing protein